MVGNRPLPAARPRESKINTRFFPVLRVKIAIKNQWAIVSSWQGINRLRDRAEARRLGGVIHEMSSFPAGGWMSFHP